MKSATVYCWRSGRHWQLEPPGEALGAGAYPARDRVHHKGAALQLREAVRSAVRTRRFGMTSKHPGTSEEPRGTATLGRLRSGHRSGDQRRFWGSSHLCVVIVSSLWPRHVGESLHRPADEARAMSDRTSLMFVLPACRVLDVSLVPDGGHGAGGRRGGRGWLLSVWRAVRVDEGPADEPRAGPPARLRAAVGAWSASAGPVAPRWPCARCRNVRRQVLELGAPRGVPTLRASLRRTARRHKAVRCSQ
jgi:hypothetical protein